MRTRVVTHVTAPVITLRMATAALMLLAVILVGLTGAARVGVSGEPPATVVTTTH